MEVGWGALVLNGRAAYFGEKGEEYEEGRRGSG